MSAAAPLLERESVLMAVAGAIAGARAGAGRLILIEGQPGVGKTALVEAAAAQATTAGMTLLRATAAVSEQDLAWGVVRSAFGSHVAGAYPFQGAAAAAAPLFVPTAPSPAAADPAALLHGLYWLLADLAAAAGNGAAVVIDDLQWVDAASARWLTHLGARVAELSVVLLLAVRPMPSQPWWSVLAASPHAAVHTLAPLSRSGSRLLVADACHDATGGNPFLLRELLRHVGSRVPEPAEIRSLRPESIRRAVLLRLAQLGRSAGELCFAIVVLGQAATLPLAAELATLSAEQADDAAAALTAAGVIQTAPHQATPHLEFVHPLVLEVIAQELPQLQRAALHLEAVRLLQRHGAGAGTLAPHLLATDPEARPEVVAILRTAAAEALSVGAPETALACLRRALAEPPPETELGEVLVELGRVEGILAEPSGVEHLQRALTLIGDPPARGRIIVALSPQLALKGEIAVALAEIEAAAAALAPDDRELQLELMGQALVFGAQILPAHAPEPATLASVGQLAGATPGERAFLAIVANVMHDSPVSASVIEDLALRALAGDLLLNDGTADGMAFWSAVSAVIFAERYDVAERQITAALADGVRRGSLRGYGFSRLFSSPLNYRLGRLQAAADDAQRAREIFAAEPMSAAYALSFLVEALIEQGELEPARAAIGTTLAAETPPLVPFAMLRVAEARLRRLEGDAAAAAAAVLLCGELLQDVSPALAPWRPEAALALYAAGDESAAAAMADTAVAHADRVGSRWVLAGALHAQGVVRRSVVPLARAEELTRAGPNRLERARVLTELGAQLRRGGQTREAERHLRDGLELAERCGAVPIAERARDELQVATGTRPRRALLSGPDSLTASEQRVSRMAAAGASNREIAQALFVSLRTVETHLTHAYLKLGVKGRDALPEALEPLLSRERASTDRTAILSR